MRILITGGAGFIGSHLVEHFSGKAEVVVLDNLRSGKISNIAPFPHRFIGGSVTDPEAVDRAMEGVDLVFHLAAMISVPESMEKPAECVEINVRGLLNVLRSASAAGARKLVLASSAASDACSPPLRRNSSPTFSTAGAPSRVTPSPPMTSPAAP